jgi:hypothetical protein
MISAEIRFFSAPEEDPVTPLSALWLPILVSAVVVFLVSSLIHMLLPWHKSDYPKIPHETEVMDALRPLGIPPGDYMVPRAYGQEMRTPEFLERLKRGPVLILTVLPNGMMSMGSSLVLWFLYSAVIGVFAAWVAGRALPAGAEYMNVFCFAAVTAFMGYALALWQMSIWYKRSWILTLKSTFDGVLYALLTAGVFGWLWPR